MFKSALSVALAVALALACVATVQGRPQGQNQLQKNYAPMPYENYWNVEDPLSGNFYGQREVSNDLGRVDGSYYVLLPDGRLQTVTYYVDGDSGFVAKVSYQKDAKPFG